MILTLDIASILGLPAALTDGPGSRDDELAGEERLQPTSRENPEHRKGESP